MKMYILIFALLIFNGQTKEQLDAIKRLTFKEIFDPDNTYYVLDTNNEYKAIKNLVKNEKVTNSSTYTYEWSNHPSKQTVYLNDNLPKGNSDGYRDISNYDFIYLNIYSQKNVGSQIILAIYCQERKPDSVSKIEFCYKTYKIQLNFSGWKEIKIPFSSLSDGYGADLTKVSSLVIHSNGWGCVPNKDTILFIDKIVFSKMKIVFNMKENEIFEENYSIILKRLKNILIKSYSLVDETNIKNIYVLKSIIKIAKKTHDGINTSGLPFNYPMKNSQDMNEIYYNIRKMVMGYIIIGGELNGDKQFFKDIIYCLDYMHDNYYTKRAQNIFTSNNWWNWDIGIPQTLVEIIIYLKDELNEKQINKYLSPVNEYIPLPSYTMANRADVAYSCIFAGAIQKNYTRIALSVEMLRELFDIIEKGDGFYDDGSFVQHDIYGYIGGYGAVLINSLSKIAYSLEETIFMFDDEMKENQFKWINNSYIPFMFEGAFHDLVRGRGVDRNIQGLKSSVGVIDSFLLVTKYIKNEKNLYFLKSYLKYIYERNQEFYNSSLSMTSLDILGEIISDKSIKTDNINNNFAKVYSRIDKAIAQINGVGLGISLSSTRTGKYESINGENRKGWYQGDGMTYIYLSPQDYASLYWPFINYYRLPGTTVTTAPRVEKDSFVSTALAKYDFVGGVYYDINMVAIMRFASENEKNNFSSSLIGNKAYFVFENIFIFIGNNITCDDNYNVETIIENRKLNGKFYFGDKEITEKSGKVTSSYIYIENYGGIYIPDYSNVKYDITDNEFLEIYFEHGKKIKDTSYKYFILPKITKNNLEKYINNIQILSETNKVIALKNKEKNIAEYVFLEKGKINNIEVDNPCTIISTGSELYIAEPSQKLKYINVKIGTDIYKVRVAKGYTSKIKIKN